jgi:putative transcriptional regulator
MRSKSEPALYISVPPDVKSAVSGDLCGLLTLGKAVKIDQNAGMITGLSSSKKATRGALDGKFLVAMPSMRDERFARSVIYVCAHSNEGAMGIVVNQPADNVRFSELLMQLGVVRAPADIVPPRSGPMRVLKGGPVETGRGFVLHTDDVFLEDSSLPIASGICLTATLDILKLIATGDGPSSAVLALGYAGWGAGQLEAEIHANGWLHCDADTDLIFDRSVDTKYERALRKIGITPGRLSHDAGHA